MLAMDEPMHYNVFNIPELIFEICSHCRRPELAALICTARRFECASEILWSELNSVEQFIFLFGQCLSCAILDPHDGDYPSLAVFNPIEPHHWERFNLYAKRVQLLCLFPQLLQVLHPTLLDALHLRTSRGAVLPNLRKLIVPYPIDWPVTEHADESVLIHLFSSPKLESLSFPPMDENVQKHRQALRVSSVALPALCPSLTTLDLTWIPVAPTPLESLLAQLVHLRTLKLYLSAQFAVTLPLSKLTKLWLCYDGDEVPPIRSDTPVTVSLESLSVLGSAQQILPMFDYFSQIPLKSLVLQCSPPSPDINIIARVVSERCAKDALQEITFRAPCGPSLRFMTNCDRLAPFFVFPNIENFTCSILPWAYPDDNFISTLAKSWPKLVSFNIHCGWDFQHGESPIVTFSSLRSLISHCPQLVDLCIEFDATILDDLQMDAPTIDGACVHTSLIRTLHVGHSPIDVTFPIAAALSRLSPQLKAIWSSFLSVPPEEEMKTKWAQVQEIILIMAKERDL